MVIRSSPDRAFDVGLLGATGFTGRLACEYLSARYASGVKWLAAGRSESKLAEVCAQLTNAPDVRVVDCTDAAAVEALVKECRVIANFAGTPFADKALPVVELCAKHGTHYVDITGESHLHRASYDRHHAQAESTSALIIHSAGYDSVPSDLGAYLAVKQLRDSHGVGCAELRTFSGASKGGVSGGTLATVLGAISGKTEGLPGVAEAKARGCYALDPAGATGGPDTSDTSLGYDARLNKWYMPNVMAAVNAPVVRKSAAMLAYSSTPGTCSYSEVSECSSRLAAYAGVASLGLAGLCFAVPPIRGGLFAAKVLPLPGEGPSREVRDTGFFHTYVLAVGDGNEEGGAPPPMAVADVRSGTAGDPGYKATAQMAIESALCVALQREACHASGGVLTPAVGLGDVLVERLNKSGMELSARTL